MSTALAASPWLLLSPLDNCAVATKSMSEGSSLEPIASQLVCGERIAAGHKVALCDIAAGEPVVKYGWPIGVATHAIQAGEWIHSHNLVNDHAVDLSQWASAATERRTFANDQLSFMGYHRPGGAVGTRNTIAVIATVNCSASVVRWAASRFDAARLAGYPHIDGVASYRHESGCGMAYEGSKHRMLDRVLRGIATHPNVGGVIVVGLGCEQATVEHLAGSRGLVQISPRRGGSEQQDDGGTLPWRSLNVQSAGGSRAAVAAIEAAIEEMLPLVDRARRSRASLADLVLGLKCGGSDGLSGVTANPILGRVSDRIVAAGGTCLLGETTEIFGAEHLLARRAVSPEVAQQLQERLDWWMWYAGLFGEQFDHNPSTGNKAGGLTTIAEKSLGAVSKSGSAPLSGVIDYASPAPKSGGLILMDSPGYDPAAVTGMMASGANVVAFTTGRGSCFGSKPVPTIKITTNTALYERMREDMDFDCGSVLAGRDFEEVTDELLRYVLDVASGERTASEQLGYGDDEFVPWTVGPML